MNIGPPRQKQKRAEAARHRLTLGCLADCLREEEQCRRAFEPYDTPVATIAPALSQALWQATRRPLENSRSTGVSAVHRSVTNGHRSA